MNILRRVIRNEDISQDEYHAFLTSVLEDRANKSTLTAYLAAIAAKPLHEQDVVHFASYIEKNTPKRALSVSDEVINIVGTGGGISTFNISTSAAFVAAASGAKVLKSGSYAHNSKCGSLDVLSNLGIKLDINDEILETMLEELNIGFASPKSYSSILRRIAVSIMPLNLREIGGFINAIGPLLCPYQVRGQICGVSSYEYIEIFSSAMQSLGMHNSIAVWAEIGLDEFSAIGLNHMAYINETIKTDTFNPLEYGMVHDNHSELNGGSAVDNAAIMQSVLLSGKPSAARDTVALNAAFVLMLSGQCDSKKEALLMAWDAIKSGAAYRLIQNTIEFSNDHKQLEKTNVN